MPESNATEVPNSLVIDIYAGLEVLKSQQTEINRRIGKIERTLDDDFVAPEEIRMMHQKVRELEVWHNEQREARPAWQGWFWQAVFWVAGITVASAIATFLGFEVKW